MAEPVRPILPERSGQAGRSRRGGSLRPAGIIGAASTVFLSVGLIGTIVLRPKPMLLWNASASSPRGLYLVTSTSALRSGDMVVAWPPPGARQLAAGRNYIPANVPLVKRIAAVDGDRVCAKGAGVSVNGHSVAARRRFDRSGRLLPRWTGCRQLASGEALLLGTAASSSFDGRYFGISRRTELIGRARLLWAA